MSLSYHPFVVMALAIALAGGGAVFSSAQAAAPAAIVAPEPSYADLADLADSSRIVLRAELRKLTRLEPERSRGVRPGQARFYVEAKTVALLTGDAGVGSALRYLVDLPLDARGKPPALKKAQALLFARPVNGRPGELQLVAPDAQLPWSPALEARLRPILTELLTSGAPPRITRLREALHVPGALAGESETQLFLTTADGSAASISVARRPGEAPRWGVSFSEVVENAGPPAPDSLPWYRLACALPRALPPAANLSDTPEDRAAAEADYGLVLQRLGPCRRTRNPPRN